MLTRETLQEQIEKELNSIDTKKHVSVRWEKNSGICRVGVMINDYTWDIRSEIIDRLLNFEDSHNEELALEFDIFQIDSINTKEFAEV